MSGMATPPYDGPTEQSKFVGHRVIEHFATYEEALAWAIESTYIEKTRFLVRLDASRRHYSTKPWEAAQSWLRNM